jgi:hypothetical protein
VEAANAYMNGVKGAEYGRTHRRGNGERLY